jgi:hypothetical protein
MNERQLAMSLSDRYNRGGGRIQGFDRYLTHMGDRFGNYWWNQTGIDRTVLTQALYVISAWAATQRFVLTGDPVVLVFVGIALMSFLGGGSSRGGLTEQIQAEVAGLPKNALPKMRFIVLGLGIFHLATAVGECAALIGTETFVTTHVGANLLLGLTLTALQASDYIRRTNPANPGSGGHGCPEPAVRT